MPHLGEALMVDPTPLVLSLSSLASSLSIASSLKNLMKIDNLSADEAWEKLKENSSLDVQIAMSDPIVASSAREVLIIDDDLLEQLNKEAKAAQNRHINARKKADAASDSQRRMIVRQADDEAATQICQILIDIKRFNGKKLPKEGAYRRWWKSYGCEALDRG